MGREFALFERGRACVRTFWRGWSALPQEPLRISRKGAVIVSLDWLERIADALDTPVAYFLVEGRGEKKIVPGDPREKLLLDAWRRLKDNPTLQGDFRRIMKDLERSAGVKSRRR